MPIHTQRGEKMSYIIILDVDEFLIAGNETKIKEIISHLRTEYELKNLGKASYCLGI